MKWKLVLITIAVLLTFATSSNATSPYVNYELEDVCGYPDGTTLDPNKVKVCSKNNPRCSYLENRLEGCRRETYLEWEMRTPWPPPTNHYSYCKDNDIITPQCNGSFIVTPCEEFTCLEQDSSYAVCVDGNETQYSIEKFNTIKNDLYIKPTGTCIKNQGVEGSYCWNESWASCQEGLTCTSTNNNLGTCILLGKDYDTIEPIEIQVDEKPIIETNSSNTEASSNNESSDSSEELRDEFTILIILLIIVYFATYKVNSIKRYNTFIAIFTVLSILTFLFTDRSYTLIFLLLLLFVIFFRSILFGVEK